MIQSERIRALPNWYRPHLTARAQEELAAAQAHGLNIVEDSIEAWAVFYDEALLLVAGVARYTALGPPVFWFLLGNEFRASYARATRALFNEWRGKYPGLIAHIETASRADCKFAKFFGFTPTQWKFSFLGRDCEVYEVRKWPS